MSRLMDPPILEAYKRRSQKADINEMSGRTGRPEVTKFVSERIIDAIKPESGDTLVDIGCGDGSALVEAANLPSRPGKLIGILPTDEEVERVRSERGAGYEFGKGSITHTGLASGIADKTICNSVFILIPRHQYVAAIRELKRITKKSGTIFIGEVMESNERSPKSKFEAIKSYIKFFRPEFHGVVARIFFLSLRSRD